MGDAEVRLSFSKNQLEVLASHTATYELPSKILSEEDEEDIVEYLLYFESLELYAEKFYETVIVREN